MPAAARTALDSSASEWHGDAPAPAGRFAALRLLVIVSGDYGELGGAMYFLYRLGLAAPPTVLLPPNLSHTMQATPGLAVHRYDTLADIRRHIEDGRFDAVMLFSGYLLTIGPRFSLLNAMRLVRLLRQRSLSVLTTDPFLGLLGRPRDLDFTSVLGQDSSSLARALTSRRLALRLVLMRRLLRQCWHVYPSPIHRLHTKEQRPRALSYCNAAVVEEFPVGRRPGTASWIFVLSDIDCQMQMRAGTQAFVDALVARLRDAIGLGKHAVVVAPQSLGEAIVQRMGACDELSMVQHAGYQEFMRHLMEAECAFYWNYYSFSIMHRVLAGLPVLFFGEGHMVQILPALREAGVRLFYDGWRPPLLRLEAPLAAADLAARAAESRQQFQRLAAGLRECDSPAQLLQRALSADQGSVLDAQA